MAVMVSLWRGKEVFRFQLAQDGCYTIGGKETALIRIPGMEQELRLNLAGDTANIEVFADGNFSSIAVPAGTRTVLHKASNLSILLGEEKKGAAVQMPPKAPAKKKGKGGLVAVLILLLLVAALAAAYFTVHIWTEATCTKASECRICGREGEALGHDWLDATCTAPKTCARCGKEKGNPERHEWHEATCMAAETCINCGESNGTPLDHEWVGGNCEEPAYCRMCGEAGESANHDWAAATTAAPETCRNCGESRGLSLASALSGCTVSDHSNSASGNDIVTGTHVSLAGNRYENAVRFWVIDADGFNNTEYAVYQLRGRYDIIDGVIAVGRDSEDGAAVGFRVYADGVLVYDSAYLEGTEEIVFSLNVTGVQKLRVECYTNEACHSYGILSAKLYIN